MTRPGASRPDKGDRYRSLSNFYLADARRIASRERDLGLWWRAGLHGPVHRAAWVRDTGELYIVRLGPAEDGTGEVEVLGRARDRNELEQALEGWRDVCPQPDSMTWLRHRAESLPRAEMPRALSRDLTHLALTGRRLQQAKAIAHRRGLTHDTHPRRSPTRQRAITAQRHERAALPDAKRSAAGTSAIEAGVRAAAAAHRHLKARRLLVASAIAGLTAPAAAALLELAAG
jgi:hypothetical protein